MESSPHIISVLNQSFSERTFLSASSTWNNHEQSISTSATGALGPINDLFRASHPFFIQDQQGYFRDSFRKIELLLGRDAALHIANRRKRIDLILLINSAGGQWEILEQLKCFITEIRVRQGRIIGFLGPMAGSAAARLLGVLDQVYAFPESDIFYHDICYQTDDGELLPVGENPYCDETGIPSVHEVIERRIEPQAKESARMKYERAKQTTPDGLVAFKARELPGFVQLIRDPEELVAFFRKETMNPLDPKKAEHDEISRLFLVWQEWLYFLGGRRKEVLDYEEQKQLDTLWTQELKQKFPWINSKILAECINGNQ